MRGLDIVADRIGFPSVAGARQDPLEQKGQREEDDRGHGTTAEGNRRAREWTSAARAASCGYE